METGVFVILLDLAGAQIVFAHFTRPGLDHCLVQSRDGRGCPFSSLALLQS
jgi:hypothetical protein